MKLFKKSLFLFVALFLAVFTLASCDKKKDNTLTELEEAAKKIVLTQDKQEVTGDFEVTSVVKVGENSYNVAWASDKEIATVGQAKDNFIPIHIDFIHNNAGATKVKLTATVTKEGSEASFKKDFSFTVPQFKVQTIAEYDAAQAKENVTVHGVIVAKEAYGANYKNTSLYLASLDGNGGVYAYRLACTEEQYNNELKIGQKIYVSGPKVMYHGLREFDGGCTYILDTDPIITPTVTDITSFVKDGSIKNKDLQNQLVKFDNLEIVSVEEKDEKGRYNVVCGDATNNITVRINTYLTATSSDAYKAYEALKLAPGMLISVSGVAGCYDGTQIHPLNADDIVVKGVNYSKMFGGKLVDATKIDDQIYGVKKITLPSTLEDVELSGEEYAGLTATWTSSSENAVISINEGEAKNEVVLTTATVTADEEVTLTLTVKKGEDVVDTRTIKFTLIKDIILDTHEEYVNAADGTELVIKGTITAIKSNKKEFWLQDENGAYYFYLKSAVDAEWFKIGNTVAVAATKGSYNGTIQLTTCTWLNTYTGEEAIKVTAADKTADFTANGYTALDVKDQGKLITFTGTWAGNKIVKVGEKEINVYFYCTTPTLTENVQYSITGLLGFYYNKSSNTTNYQVFILDTNAFVDSRPADVRAQAALDSIVATIGTTKFEESAELTLNKIFADATLTVTPQTGATSLAWNAEKSLLTITAGTTEVSETVTIKVQIGEVVKEATVTIVSQVNSNALKDTIATDKTKDYVVLNDTNDYAAKAGLDASLFSLVFNTNTCTNSSGVARFHDTNGLQLYAAGGLTVTGKGINILSITVTLKEDKSFTYNDKVYETVDKVVTISINDSSFTLTNHNTAQIKIDSIEITYAMAE